MRCLFWMPDDGKKLCTLNPSPTMWGGGGGMMRSSFFSMMQS
ncbi:MAG: hypothetical protein ACK5H6_01825 [Bacteroidota bacterium]